MSRSFQQKSLIDGLFITDSGIMEATKFANQDSLYFRCTIDVCFFQTSPPNLCNDVRSLLVFSCYFLCLFSFHLTYYFSCCVLRYEIMISVCLTCTYISFPAHQIIIYSSFTYTDLFSCPLDKDNRPFYLD